MEDQFSAEAWQKLSVDKRIRFCLRMAKGLRKLAAASDPKTAVDGHARHDATYSKHKGRVSLGSAKVVR